MMQRIFDATSNFKLCLAEALVRYLVRADAHGVLLGNGAKTRIFLAELVTALTPTTNWKRINKLTYSTSSFYGISSVSRGLTEHEQEAVTHCFPKPPAYVLVCGCGSGRELIALAEQGYVVGGLDVSSQLLENARTCVPQQALKNLLCAAYEDIPNLKIQESLGIPDAVVVGWGSFLMIENDRQRITALTNLRKICPRGPILISLRFSNGIGPRRRLLRQLMRVFQLNATSSIEQAMYTPISGLFRLLSKADFLKIVEGAGERIQYLRTVGSCNYVVLTAENNSK